MCFLRARQKAPLPRTRCFLHLPLISVYPRGSADLLRSPSRCMSWRSYRPWPRLEWPGPKGQPRARTKGTPNKNASTAPRGLAVRRGAAGAASRPRRGPRTWGASVALFHSFPLPLWEDFLLELGLVAALGIGDEAGRNALSLEAVNRACAFGRSGNC